LFYDYFFFVVYNRDFGTKSTDNSATFEGIISKLNKVQGTKKIKAITIGNNMVQQNDISWSKRILGNEARAQMNIKIIIQDFRPKFTLYNNPSVKGFEYANIPLSKRFFIYI
jgi:hypothetical protein